MSALLRGILITVALGHLLLESRAISRTRRKHDHRVHEAGRGLPPRGDRPHSEHGVRALRPVRRLQQASPRFMGLGRDRRRRPSVLDQPRGLVRRMQRVEPRSPSVLRQRRRGSEQDASSAGAAWPWIEERGCSCVWSCHCPDMELSNRDGSLLTGRLDMSKDRQPSPACPAVVQIVHRHVSRPGVKQPCSFVSLVSNFVLFSAVRFHSLKQT